jgi:hypothetical protein
MKRTVSFYVLLCVFILFTGCDKEPTLENNGTLSFQMRTWSTYEGNAVKSALNGLSDSIVLDFLDVKGYKYEMKVTTDEISPGLNDSDIDWITIYQSDELKEDGERDFQFTLPAGDYKGFALWQGNEFFWIGEDNGNIIEIPTSNGSDRDSVYNVFGSDGLYTLNDNDELEKVSNNEKLGVSFTINEEQTTTLTVRVNFTGIEWYDNDQSGTWSDGDGVGDMLLPDGVDTMSDFIVVYE